MNKKDNILKVIQEQGVLPLYFHQDQQVSIEVLKALYAAGARTVEYTNRGAAAFENFKLLRKICDEELKEMYLGIGTITDQDAATKFIQAGADFLVCPGMVPAVAAVAASHDILWVPGCMTPSEIIEADHLGAPLIKLFPGNLLGPSFVSAIKPVFRHLLFMPTGGVDTSRENLESWFSAGVCAVGMGSKLLSKDLLESKDYGTITDKTMQVLQLISSLPKK